MLAGRVDRSVSRGLVVCALLAVGCHRSDETEDVVDKASEALTHAQVGAAKSAGLLPDAGTTIELLDPVVPAGITAPMTAAYGINSAGTIVGSSYSPDVTYLYPWMPVLHPLLKDATGSHYVQGPWADGSTTLSGISDDGTVVGYGGPAANEGESLKMSIPFVLHPDGSHHILPGAAFGTTFAQVVSERTGKPLAVGQYSWPYTAVMPGTMNHWPFDGDGSDTAYYTPSPMPTVASDFYPATTDERGQTRALLTMDGSRCLQVPASTAQHIDDPTSEGPGVTMMAWIRPGSTTCATANRVVLMDDLEAMMTIACNPNGTVGVTSYFYDPAGPATSPLAGEIPLGAWAHIAVTWDKHTIRTYINGVRAGSVTRDGVLHPYFGLPLSIGCNYSHDPAYNFVGAMHDVALIRNPLAQDQILQAANGHANYHFGTNGNWTRYRINDDGDPEVSLLPMPETNGGNYWQGAASGVAPDGTIVGYTYDAVGSAAMLYNPIDGTHDLNRELPPGEIAAWRLSTANGVNSSQVVVGVGTHNGIGAAYRFDVKNGVISEIPSIEGVWYTPNPVVTSINAAGHIAGYSTVDWASSPGRAFVYTQETGSTDLNDLLAPSIAAAGWVLRSAHIYDGDVIIGQAENTNTGVKKGYKMTLAGLPQPAQIECAGVADGTPCTHGKFCPNNNVCYQGVCGGADPADAVCLRVDGVVAVQGRPVALFGFDNVSGQTVNPAVNQEMIDNIVIALPNPAPPAWLPAGDHAAAFRPIFDYGATVSWRLNGQKVTADAAHMLTPLAGLPGVQVSLPGDPPGTPPLVVQPDLSTYSSPPRQITAAAEPNFDTEFNGVLTGEFGVSQTGAATYTVPISIPPGIAGMAPNLKLVYNSQGGDGIAGQGIELTGLSMIHRCPMTVAEDGSYQPINVKQDPALDGVYSDYGVCLDGRRLFHKPCDPNDPSLANKVCYDPATRDFSKITYDKTSQAFTVVTKSGETRSYGTDSGGTSSSRVEATLTGDFPGTYVVAWALDKIQDLWGNYYELHYDYDDPTKFLTEGLYVTKVRYTGHVATATEDASEPFNDIAFSYEDRTDVRHIRLGSVSIPKKKRLTGITTPLGTYVMHYKDDDVTLPSRLGRISYCSATACLGDLNLDWDAGLYGWQAAQSPDVVGQENSYVLPAALAGGDLAPGGGVRGTQFVDLDADGRPDFVQALDQGATVSRHVWWNNGRGWTQRDAWTPPIYFLATWSSSAQSYVPTGARFVDMDGDGRPDFVANGPNGPNRPQSSQRHRLPQQAQRGRRMVPARVWIVAEGVDGRRH